MINLLANAPQIAPRRPPVALPNTPAVLLFHICRLFAVKFISLIQKKLYTSNNKI